jgi:hypothetical protein
MNQLKLGSIKKNYKQVYCLYLSPDHRYEFTSLKKAQKFLNDLELIVQQKLESANEIYKNAFSVYRTLFFFIELNADKENVFQQLESIEFQYRLIYSGRYNESSNGASFCYEKTIRIYQSLLVLLRSLHSISEEKRQITLKHSLQTNIRFISLELKSLYSLQKEVFTDYKLSKDYELRIVS